MRLPAVHPTAILIDGEPRDTVAASDRGLQFGDGVFETLAVDRGRPLLLDAHLDRLQEGAGRLAIDPGVNRDTLVREIHAVGQGLERGVVKLIVTRGTGGRGYAPPPAPAPTRVVSAHPWPDHVAAGQRDGVQTGVSPIRLARQPALAGIKHLNRLEQVLARIHWRAGWQEALMLDDGARVIEASAANLFIARDGRVCTPPLDGAGVAGLIRRQILDGIAAVDGVPVVERPLEPADLYEADEVFLTNCVIGLWPVTQVDDCRYPVGAVSRALQDRLNEKALAIFA